MYFTELKLYFASMHGHGCNTWLLTFVVHITINDTKRAYCFFILWISFLDSEDALDGPSSSDTRKERKIRLSGECGKDEFYHRFVLLRLWLKIGTMCERSPGWRPLYRIGLAQSNTELAKHILQKVPL